MENDKLFNFMEKMYSEMQNMKTEMQTGFKEVKADIKEIKSDIKELKVEVTKTNMVIENEIKPKLEALFDGYKQNSEQITDIQCDIKKINKRLDTIALENLDIRNEFKEIKLEVIKGGKE
jgi:predicted phage-related endonuclease